MGLGALRQIEADAPVGNPEAVEGDATVRMALQGVALHVHCAGLQCPGGQIHPHTHAARLHVVHMRVAAAEAGEAPHGDHLALVGEEGLQPHRVHRVGMHARHVGMLHHGLLQDAALVQLEVLHGPGPVAVQ